MPEIMYAKVYWYNSLLVFFFGGGINIYRYEAVLFREHLRC